MHSIEIESGRVLIEAGRAVGERTLRSVLMQHATDSCDHAARLEEVYVLAALSRMRSTSESGLALLNDLRAALINHRALTSIDAAVICSVQAIEHHEIAIYGTLREWAEQLDLLDAVEIFQSILEEEAAFDAYLSELADNANSRAAAR